jgi:D-alanine-D-alanine ligase
MKLRIGVLYGGRSGEHDVSLCSAASIVSALDPTKYEIVAIGIDRDGRWFVQDRPIIVDHADFGKVLKIEKKGTWYVNHFEKGGKLVLHNIEDGNAIGVDVVFPAVHGTFCEDGTLQGLLELAMVPYVGADSIGSSVGIDKDISKRLLRDGGIPVVPWLTVSRAEWRESSGRVIEEVVEKLMGPPFFVKPARTGSSVGVKKVKRRDELADAVDYAFMFDTKVLIEKGVEGREIECSVLGNDEPLASVLGEIIPSHEFYSYESKYIDPDGAKLVVPADVKQPGADSIRKTAVMAYRTLCCSGMARVDFFLEKSGVFYVNEINTIPGFTGISMYPKLWERSGIGYSALIDNLIELALERHRDKMRIRTER